MAARLYAADYPADESAIAHLRPNGTFRAFSGRQSVDSTEISLTQLRFSIVSSEARNSSRRRAKFKLIASVTRYA